MALKSIYVNEELHRQAKLYAAEQGKKLREVIEEFIATGLHQKRVAAERDLGIIEKPARMVKEYASVRTETWPTTKGEATTLSPTATTPSSPPSVRNWSRRRYREGAARWTSTPAASSGQKPSVPQLASAALTLPSPSARWLSPGAPRNRCKDTARE